jgi:hypothetical protein
LHFVQSCSDGFSSSRLSFPSSSPFLNQVIRFGYPFYTSDLT